MKVLVTEECGEYRLDCNQLLDRLQAATSQVFAQTGRRACIVELQKDDAEDLALFMFPASSKGSAVPTEIHGIPVALNDSVGRRRGVAIVRQCELPHPTSQDCPYHAQTTRRLASRDIPVSIEMPRLPK